MATERRSVAVYATAAALTQEAGPIITKYALLESGRLYEWTPADESTVDNINVIGHTGGTVGRWLIKVPYLPVYTVATVPAATTAGGQIYVSDEAGGAVTAFSDGTNWRRSTDRAIVS